MWTWRRQVRLDLACTFHGGSGGGYPGWGRYGKGYRCKQCRRLSGALRIKCYAEFWEKYHARLRAQLVLLRKVLRAQSNCQWGWKAVFKGADLEKGEEGFISWMPLRHYSGRYHHHDWGARLAQRM